MALVAVKGNDMKPHWQQRRSMAMSLLLMIVMGFVASLVVSARGVLAQDDKPTEAMAVISPVDDSAVEGVASLRETRKGTVVTIRVDNALGDHPTHIHQGTCDDLDPNPEYPLRNVQLRSTSLAGTSKTTVDVSMDELLGSDHLILIHESESDIGTYLACGDIVSGSVDVNESAAGDSGNPLPDTGVGSASSGSLLNTIALLTAASAALLILGIIAARLAPTASATRSRS